MIVVANFLLSDVMSITNPGHGTQLSLPFSGKVSQILSLFIIGEATQTVVHCQALMSNTLIGEEK